MLASNGGARCRTMLAIILMMAAAGVCRGQLATAVQRVELQLAPNGKLAATAVTLAPSGTAFAPFAGTGTISYVVRTSAAGGATITLQAGSEFTPSGGPTVASGALRYQCAGATLGTSCTGVRTVSLSSQTPVVQLPAPCCTGGGGQCSQADPNTVQVNFLLDNDPSFSTGTYSTTITITITTL